MFLLPRKLIKSGKGLFAADRKLHSKNQPLRPCRKQAHIAKALLGACCRCKELVAQ
jgi:hypothetical protein